MKAKVKVNDGDTVEIELTPEQITEYERKSKGFRSIKTVEDAFEFLGINYQEWLDKRNNLEPHEIAYGQLTIIAKALNGGEWMTYDDTDKYKYYPWFHAKGSGSGFAFDDYGCGGAYSGVGSRLCSKSREIAEYAGKQFLNIYNQYIN
ncbi:hypothetical protein [Emticicia sp. BO119]|uniref:hypothetical protein n=1 Tax=Emticicia sp. BO119 TaxID=2757768 RepID=UPI0015F00E4A|nr:hypothetical protein [Emticicia sp. BO119]MBA4849462.1 hypothetical protein [Emticicia sp. BO119]